MKKSVTDHRKPEVLLFDLGNVLFPFDWAPAIEGFAQILDRPAIELTSAFRHADYAILFYEFGTGRISAERFVRKLNEHLECNLSMETIANIWCSIFREDRKMTALVFRLARRYRTFIVSDTDAFHWNYLDEIHGLEERITGAILSFRYGNMKADPGAFAKIIRDYRFNPKQTWFIDDLEKNIKAANNAGLNTILHTSYEATLQSLKKQGIEIN